MLPDERGTNQTETIAEDVSDLLFQEAFLVDLGS
jgi:hypothetical protein